MPIHLATRACCLLAAVLLTGCIHPSQQSTPHAPGTQASSSELSSVDASPGEAAARARCTRYFESGQWSYRYDPGIRKNAWTLELTPTYCGRRIHQDETNAAYTELYSATAVTGAGASTTGAACVVSWCATWPPPATRKPGTWSLFDPMCLIAYRWLPVAIRRHVDRQFQHCSTRSGP